MFSLSFHIYLFVLSRRYVYTSQENKNSKILTKIILNGVEICSHYVTKKGQIHIKTKNLKRTSQTAIK